MKYNEELFELSDILNIGEQGNDVDPETEIELLEILIKKCLDNLYTIKNNYMTITFNYPMFGNPERGYSLIYSLVKQNKFDKLAREYGFYLRNINLNHSDYTDDNIEIMWDYKLYNESVKTLELQNTNNS